VQWLGFILGALFVAFAVFYIIVGFLPDSATSKRMRSRLEFSADVGWAKGYRINTAGLYGWMLRTKLRSALVATFLLFWGVWFIAASSRMWACLSERRHEGVARDLAADSQLD
jgi:hypothetical protein